MRLISLAAVMLLTLLPALTARANTTDPLGYIQADQLQTAGLTGKGIKVGVISNGVQDLAGVQALGALPAAIGIVDAQPGFGGEGIAMLQVVHQIAPDAALYFCSLDVYSVATCADKLVQQFGVNVVVDDAGGGLDQAPYSDAVLYQNVITAHPAIFAVHAAGNFANAVYQSVFVPVASVAGGIPIQAQDFGASLGHASQPYDTSSVPAGASLNVCYHTSDDPTLYPVPASNNVMGLWVLDDTGHVLASTSGTSPNTCVIYTNTGASSISTRIVTGVIQQNNSLPLFLGIDLEMQAGGSSISLGLVSPGGAGGALATAPGLSVAASGSGGALEPFSQTGPYLLTWSATQTGTTPSGQPTLAFTRLPQPTYLKKPDLTGEDGWTITPVSSFSNGTSYFNGTSAAAPSVAGIAALLMQAGLSKDQIVTALEQSAKPLSTDPDGNPIVQSQGTWNQMDGYGLIQGYAALKQAGVALPQPAITSAAGPIQTGQTETFTGDCTVSGGLTVTGYEWTFSGTDAKGNHYSLPDSSEQNPGAVTFKNAATWSATFNCTDSAGLSSGEPASVSFAVTAPPPPPPPSGGTGSGSSGGGGMGLLLLGLLGFLGRSRKRHVQAGLNIMHPIE